MGVSNRKALSAVGGGSNTGADNGQAKDDEIKDDENAVDEEREKKFEPSNHLESELVDILGKLSRIKRLVVILTVLISCRTRYFTKESERTLGRYCRSTGRKAST